MNKKQKKRLYQIIACVIMIVAISIVGVSGVLKLALYLITYIIIGHDILKKAVKGIIKGQVLDENFLMAIATVGAFIMAIYSRSEDYLECVAVMLFYQIGELFQSYAVGKSRDNIAALMDIRPDYANIMQDGELTRVDPEDVSVGSVIIVPPGEKVPLDGVVVKGSSR